MKANVTLSRNSTRQLFELMWCLAYNCDGAGESVGFGGGQEFGRPNFQWMDIVHLKIKLNTQENCANSRSRAIRAGTSNEDRKG